MSRYAVSIPGNWPAQFHVPKAVYSRCGFQPPTENDLDTASTSSNGGTAECNKDGLHHYSMSTTSDSILNSGDGPFTDPLQSAVPMLGPLHISLNSQENVMQNFHPFSKYL